MSQKNLRIVLIMAMVVVSAINVSFGQQPHKLALLIGINDYVSDEVSDLEGCVNDVEDMKNLLTGTFDFPEQNIVVLKDQEATHKGIVSAFESHLIKKAKNDSIVVFHYSGHGSQMKDTNGDETDDLDESLVSHDSRTEGVFDAVTTNCIDCSRTCPRKPKTSPSFWTVVTRDRELAQWEDVQEKLEWTSGLHPEQHPREALREGQMTKMTTTCSFQVVARMRNPKSMMRMGNSAAL